MLSKQIHKIRKLFLCFILFYFSNSFALLYGQSFETGLFNATYINDTILKQINFDGNLNEWKIITENNSISNKTKKNIDNFNKGENVYLYDCFIGWNSVSNWLYIVLKIKSKTMLVDKFKHFWHQDKINIAVNPQNYLIVYEEVSTNKDVIKGIIRYVITYAEGGLLMTYAHEWHYAEWLLDTTYINYGLNIDHNKKDDYYLISLELGFQLWDHWEYEGSEYSVPHDLKPNETIGLTININNQIRGPGNITYSILDGENIWEWHSKGISKLYLEPEKQKY